MHAQESKINCMQEKLFITLNINEETLKLQEQPGVPRLAHRASKQHFSEKPLDNYIVVNIIHVWNDSSTRKEREWRA